MKQISVVIAAFVGLGLIVFGVFLLCREIGMEGRVVAEPTPLVVDAPPVASVDGGGAGVDVPTITPVNEQYQHERATVEAVAPTAIAMILNPPEASNGCITLDVDLREEDVYVNIPFDAYVMYLPKSFNTTDKLYDVIAIEGDIISEGMMSYSGYSDMGQDQGSKSVMIMPYHIITQQDYRNIAVKVHEGEHLIRLMDIDMIDGVRNFVFSSNRNQGETILYICP